MSGWWKYYIMVTPVLLLPSPCSGHHGSLKSAMLGPFTPQKSGDTTKSWLFVFLKERIGS